MSRKMQAQERSRGMRMGSGGMDGELVMEDD